MEENDVKEVLLTSTVKIWEASLTVAAKNTPKQTNRDYSLIPADAQDIKKMLSFYGEHAIEGYDIQSVEVVYNPYTEMAFQMHCHKLQKREGNPAFVPKWPNESPTTETDWRQRVSDKWNAMAFRDNTYRHIKLLPFWHGTDPAILGSIFETGYANLATTDSGFFGKGLYFSNAADYAYRCYSRGEGKEVGVLGEGGVVLLNWVASFSAYPVIQGDIAKLSGKGNYQNYDAHFIPVMPKSPNNPNEVDYYPCDTIDMLATYYELVTFESGACLPRYLITVQKILLKSLQTSLDAMAFYRAGLSYKKGPRAMQDGSKAFACFFQAANLALPLGQLETGWCYRKGEGVAKDVAVAFNYFSLAAESGLGSAIHELGWCYKRGEGVNKDTQKAAAYFKAAADKGVAGGAFDMGCCYYTGEGVPKNRQTAAFYFKQAADKGVLSGQLRFAQCCADGDGISKNLDKAVTYYRLAAEQGDDGAKERLHNLLTAQLNHLRVNNRRLFFAEAEINTPQPSQTPATDDNCRLQ